MLKAYDYVETAPNRSSIQAAERFNEELRLARAAVGRAIQMNAGDAARCPGCSGEKLTPFFTKWGVSYLRCEGCGSVFADVDDETLSAYRGDEVLQKFRRSESYQREAAQKRAGAWQEVIDWVIFRSFRYLKRKAGLRILSGGDRYTGFADLVQKSELCGTYSVLPDEAGKAGDRAQIALSLNLLQQTNHPEAHLAELNRRLEKGGLLFLSARTGTGFDILVLREHAQIYPYEYVTLLSREGLANVLQKAGFALLDYSTPGYLDVGYVRDKRAYLPRDELFVRTLMAENDPVILGEFQRFLQKSGMSSYVHIVAEKEEDR